jgi:hypothetical protein
VTHAATNASSPHHETSHAPHGLAAELVLGTLAVLAVLLVGVYLPIGLSAVAVQDASSIEMRTVLGGDDAPLALRLYDELAAWTPGLVSAACVAACLNVLLRRMARRRLAWGGSLAWDVLGSPLLVFLGAVALLAVLAAMAVASISNGAALVAGAAGAAAVTLSVGGFAAYAWRRFRAVRVALLAVAGALLLVRIGGDLWGRSRLNAFDARWEKEIAAEREQRLAGERPVLRGAALDEDAAPRYEAVIARLRADSASLPSHPDLFALDAAASHGPFAPIPGKVRELVARRARDVAEVRAAAGCRRSSLGLVFDPEALAGDRPWASVRWLGGALVVACHERAQKGDLKEAASCYLDAVRVASDVSAGPLLRALVAFRLEEAALNALGRLVLSQKLDRATLARVESERSRLEPFRVSFADGERGSRLLLGKMERTIARSPAQAGLREPPLLAWLVPYRALAADGVWVADAFHREREQALGADDAARCARLAAEVEARAGASFNPIRRSLSGVRYDGSDSTQQLLGLARRGLAHFRLAQASLALEALRLETGRYPGVATARLPRDPFAPEGTLRFAPDGPSVRIWSVGLDGRDGGGDTRNLADVVLARE